jgi:hypothetical protein
MERAVTQLLKATSVTVEDLHRVRLADLLPGKEREALLRRRQDLGLSTELFAPVMVDDSGQAIPAEQIPLRLRFARTTRISIDGNAHFCRGLLRTRYDGSGSDQAPRAQDPEPVLHTISTSRSEGRQD